MQRYEKFSESQCLLDTKFVENWKFSAFSRENWMKNWTEIDQLDGKLIRK